LENIYVQVGVNLGVLGLLVWLLFWGIIFWMIFEKWWLMS